MALQESSRQTFAISCTQMCKKFNLDGIDIDWEFPGYRGEGGNIYRPEDKQNYTLLFKTLREAFDQLEQQTEKKYQLTTAVDGWASHYLPHTEMGQVQQYVDYILLMTYNFNTKDSVGGTFLYPPKNWNPLGCADGAVTEFEKAGVPANKLVVGMGFFPAAFNMATANAADRKYVSKTKISGGLAYIYNHLVNKNGYVRYWDDDGKAPYLFNATILKRISYEDQESVKAKCSYVKEKQVAGVMYWQYNSDPKRALLNTVFTTLK
jgi:chitinase